MAPCHRGARATSSVRRVHSPPTPDPSSRTRDDH
jgi:hypothetical protein